LPDCALSLADVFLSYTFSFPDPNATAGGETASALLVKASDAQSCLDAKGKPVIRPYTPISPQNQRGTMELMVKVYPVGIPEMLNAQT
jgi:cytochrome-b5 reductase